MEEQSTTVFQPFMFSASNLTWTWNCSSQSRCFLDSVILRYLTLHSFVAEIMVVSLLSWSKISQLLFVSPHKWWFCIVQESRCWNRVNPVQGVSLRFQKCRLTQEHTFTMLASCIIIRQKIVHNLEYYNMEVNRELKGVYGRREFCKGTFRIILKFVKSGKKDTCK